MYVSVSISFYSLSISDYPYVEECKRSFKNRRGMQERGGVKSKLISLTPNIGSSLLTIDLNYATEVKL